MSKPKTNIPIPVYRFIFLGKSIGKKYSPIKTRDTKTKNTPITKLN